MDECGAASRGAMGSLWGCCSTEGQGQRNPDWSLLGCLFWGRNVFYFYFLEESPP